MEKIIEEISNKFNKSPQEVRGIITEYFTLLHKLFYECKGDFFGAPSYYNLGPKAYFHLLGMVELFVAKYDWEPGSASKYLHGFGLEEDWKLFADEVKKWESEVS